MDNDQTKPDRYEVILKNGDHSVFINDRFHENYEARLLSGMYGIVTSERDTPVTTETVQSIRKLDPGEEAEV